MHKNQKIRTDNQKMISITKILLNVTTIWTNREHIFLQHYSTCVPVNIISNACKYYPSTTTIIHGQYWSRLLHEKKTSYVSDVLIRCVHQQLIVIVIV